MMSNSSLYRDAERILISKEEIAARVAQLAGEISANYLDKNPIILCVLKGAAVFFADLIRRLDFALETDFMAISSYEDATRSSGEVRVVKDTDKSLLGRHVILVEDIVDTGLTLSYLKNMLLRREPASFKICALLDKPERREVDIKPDYTGFTVPNHFIIGYGLDYAQHYRNMPDLCVLKESVYKK